MVTEATAQPAAPPVEAVIEQPLIAPAAVVEEAQPVVVAPPVAAAQPPAPAAPVLTPVAAAPAMTQETQEYIRRLEQQNQTAQAQQEMRVLQEVVTQYAQLLEREQGLTPEQATYVAQREGNRIKQQYDADQFRKGQYLAALDIGKKNGVDPRTLMDLPTVPAMEAAAQAATGQNRLAAENAALKAEVERLKKASVPPQTFASGAVGGDGGKATADNIDGMFMKWEREHPNATEVNPYSAAYRRLLATGTFS